MVRVPDDAAMLLPEGGQKESRERKARTVREEEISRLMVG